jgi:hypothetical protein
MSVGLQPNTAYSYLARTDAKGFCGRLAVAVGYLRTTRAGGPKSCTGTASSPLLPSQSFPAAQSCHTPRAASRSHANDSVVSRLSAAERRRVRIYANEPNQLREGIGLVARACVDFAISAHALERHRRGDGRRLPQRRDRVAGGATVPEVQAYRERPLPRARHGFAPTAGSSH